MSSESPVVAIVTTQPWGQVARLAMRFAAYGSPLTAICPPSSQLNQLGSRGLVAACHPLRAIEPLRSIERAVARSGADFLVPADDLAVWLLHALSRSSPRHAQLVERSMGSAANYGLIRSRHRLLALAGELGIAAPRTEQVRSAAQVEGVVRGWGTGGPFVIKKDGTWGGGGVAVVGGLGELPERYAALVRRPGLRARLKQGVMHADPGAFVTLPELGEPEMSVQEYVEGVAANAMFACDRGRVLGGVQARVVASKAKTGPALMIQLMDDPRIARAGQLLAESLQLSGFFGLDFILSDAAGGAPYLIEMNPRCTQLGHVAVRGQADLAGMLWAAWTGGEAPPAGPAGLSDSIAFYPQALEWAAGSPFLEDARLDVGEEERQVVDALPSLQGALPARMYRAVRKPIRRWTQAPVPSRVGEIFYFNQRWSGLGSVAGGSFHSTIKA
ncbi:MAG TPA: ATP-grasp domain-containing protein [Acidobacteriaceae bacterium]